MNIKQANQIPARRAPHRVARGALALAAAVALGSVFTLAEAASTPSAAAPSTSAAANSGDKTDALLRFSQAGHDAFDRIRIARVDLFDGKTDAAMKEMKAAQLSLITAKAEAPTFSTTTRTKEMGKVVGTSKDSFTAQAVPVGGDLVLADNFQLTEQHKPVLAKANEHLANGNKKAAVEVLKAGDIDVSYNRQWLPISSAEKNLDKAISLTTAKHFYDANLALKAIEDGVQTDSVNFDVPPATS
ncbi:MAG: YfdX family protein [Ideonella sp.]